MSVIEQPNALKDYLDSLTQEQRDGLLLQARASRVAKAAEREANKHLLKLTYLDKGHWADLASQYGVRMPFKDEAVSARVIRKYLNKADVAISVWNDHYTSAAYFVKHNPNWTSYAAAGLVLELRASM